MAGALITTSIRGTSPTWIIRALASLALFNTNWAPSLLAPMLGFICENVYNYLFVKNILLKITHVERDYADPSTWGAPHLLGPRL
jgi:hypothetical protein